MKAPGVSQVKVGDRVSLPFNIGCGFCFNCERGMTGFCFTVNPNGAGGAYGFAGMGPYQGGQAEYLRVPFADFNCLELPGPINQATTVRRVAQATRRGLRRLRRTRNSPPKAAKTRWKHPAPTPSGRNDEARRCSRGRG